MVGVSEFSLIALLLSGGALTGLPVGLPPAEADPKMLQVAPDDPLVYLSWAGVGEPDAHSANNAERLLAEPEVQQLVKTIVATIEKAATDNQALVAQDAAKVVKQILTSPMVLYVGDVKIGPAGVDAPVGLVLKVGDNADFRKSIVRLQQIAGPAEIEEVDGINWSSWPSRPPVPAIKWGFAGDYFILGVGTGTVEGIQKRMAGDTVPKFLSNIRKRLPVDQISGVTHINVPGIVKAAAPFLQQVPQFQGIYEQLGLDALKGFTTVSGFDKTHIVTRTWVSLDEKRTGIFGLIDAKQLTAEDLAVIPDDASLAFAARIDVGKTVERFIDLVAEFEPRAREEFDEGCDEVEQVFGYHPINDLAKSVGDRWCIYHSASQGGAPHLGWTAVVSVKDADRLRAVSDKIHGFAKQWQDRNTQDRYARMISIATTSVGNHKVYFANPIGEEMPIAPAWCVTDDELIISMYPQGIKEYLGNKGKGKTLADLTSLKSRLASRPMMVSYYDSKRLFTSLYPVVLMGANVLCAELQRNHVDVNISLMPNASSIARHMQPSTTSINVAADGIELYSNRTLPIPIEMAPSLLMPMWLGVRTYTSTRMMHDHAADAVAAPPIVRKLGAPVGIVARGPRNPAMNNLKQIGLALHNYHDAFNRLPSGGLNADGKTGLSWRVHLLPFLEQQALYKQFRLNESWDSDHNKKLISKMPQAYQSPGSKAKAGTSNYVVLRHEGAMITGKKGKRFADVKDGLSNTIMVVEADDKNAVVWTKPEDLAFDPKKPHSGLGKLRKGVFFALLGDGSVRSLPIKISAEMLRRLADCADGNVVKVDSVQKGATDAVDDASGEVTPDGAEASEGEDAVDSADANTSQAVVE